MACEDSDDNPLVTIALIVIGIALIVTRTLSCVA